MQQLILGTGTAIWWLTEPHFNCVFAPKAAKIDLTLTSKARILQNPNFIVTVAKESRENNFCNFFIRFNEKT
jgi:hypothetical protein